MNRYETYKDSGIPWLGEIPEHWNICRLKDEVTFNDEVLGDKTDTDYEILYVDISNVSLIEGIIQKELMTFEHSPSRARRIVKNGDVIVSTVRTYLKAITQIQDAEDNLIVSTGFAVLRPKADLFPRFLGYWVQSENMIGAIVSNSVGVSYPAINTTDLVRLPIVKLPKKEQTAIAHYLDTKLGEIDALIGKQQNLLEKLAEQRTAVITHAVTKGLNPAAPMKNSSVEWLGDVPAHWDEGKLKNICSAFGRIGFRGYSTADLVSEGEGPITLSPSNIKNTNMDYEKCTYLSWEKYLESPEIMLHKNDIVIVKTGSSYGKVGFIDDLPTEATINPQLLVIKRININSKYLFYVLLSEIFQFQINQNVIGSTIPTISESKILNFNTPYPSDINEQITIADYLDQETAKIDRLCDTVNQTIGRLKEYRTALITQAVTGKIKVMGESIA